MHPTNIESITLYPGFDKSGNSEGFETLTLKRGYVYAIVGKTGAGKTQLMEDIESINQGEGVTKRRIAINSAEVDESFYSFSRSRMIAHLSQSMNFVLDMPVLSFLEHRYEQIEQTEKKDAEKVLAYANTLSGEPISPMQSLTKLSGGQSRALMITDVALNSNAPVILIDELENAGIDRFKAMQLLAGRDKIILIATHDPLLALYGDYRIVLKNGAIHQVVKKTEAEEGYSKVLKKWYDAIDDCKASMREGKPLHITGGELYVV